MKNTISKVTVMLLILVAGPFVAGALAQAPLPNPPQPPVAQGAALPGPAPAAYPAAELDRIVSPIALYPDPLLAQVLAAATFYDQIPDAAGWAGSLHDCPGA